MLQLPASPRDPARFATVASQDLFEPGAMLMRGDALAMTGALVIEPAVVTRAWSGEIIRRRVARLERDGSDQDGIWRLLDEAGALIVAADRVAVAGGAASADLLPRIFLKPVRGQASWAVGETTSATAFGGYAAPTRDGVLFGATHDRDQTAVDIRPEDHARNLDTLAKGLPDLAARLAGKTFEGRAAVRATTPDRLPLAGIRDDGLMVLTGLGSRGFCLAPLLAEHLIAKLLGHPSPLPRQLSHLTEFGRFDSPGTGIGV